MDTRPFISNYFPYHCSPICWHNIRPDFSPRRQTIGLRKIKYSRYQRIIKRHQQTSPTQSARTIPNHGPNDPKTSTRRNTNPPAHIQLNTQIKLLASSPKTSQSNHGTKTGEKSKRGIFLSTNQPSTHFVKYTSKTHPNKTHKRTKLHGLDTMAPIWISQKSLNNPTVPRLVDTINKALEEKSYCPAVFLDVSQAFDIVWHRGLLLKILQTLPTNYFSILQSYLQCRYLTITYNNETSSPIPMLSGVLQGSILGPLLYTLYIADIPLPPSQTSALTPMTRPYSPPTTTQIQPHQTSKTISRVLNNGPKNGG